MYIHIYVHGETTLLGNIYIYFTVTYIKYLANINEKTLLDLEIFLSLVEQPSLFPYV